LLRFLNLDESIFARPVGYVIKNSFRASSA